MAETKLPDVIETLYALLSVGWTSGNANDRTPLFFKRGELKRADHTSDDVVGIYDKAALEGDVGILHAHTTYEHHATVEVRTSYTATDVTARRQANAMRSEIARIINAGGKTPTTYTRYDSSTSYEAAAFNYDLIEIVGSNPVWDGKDDCRWAVEVKATKYWQVQHTS